MRFGLDVCVCVPADVEKVQMCNVGNKRLNVICMLTYKMYFWHPWSRVRV